MDNVEVRELMPGLLDDYLNFFDHEAFADNPSWSHCYCAFYHRDYEDQWPTPPDLRAQNRIFKSELIRSGKAPGFLAYVDGKVVGWCNAGPRAGYQNLRHFAAAVEDPNEPVGTLLCFIIAAGYRKQGVASALLAAACEKFKRDGLTVAEGYPTVKFSPLPYELSMNARSYHGPLSMYLKAGFKIQRGIGNWAIVRKSL